MSEQPATRSLFRRYWWVIVGLIIAVATVVILAPAASDHPDGLDRVAEDKEFHEKAKDPPYEWLPDYTIPGVENEWASVVLSGIIGVAIVFAVAVLFGVLVRQNRRARAP